MKSVTKHIVLLTPGFPQSESDTTCIPALQIFAAHLSQMQNYTVSVITFHYPATLSKYNWNGIPVYPLGSASRLAKPLLWRKARITLEQIHAENPITAAHSFWLGECALVGHWFSKKHQVKHLTTLMGQDALKNNFYAKLLPLRKLQLITLSAFHQTVFRKNYNIETNIIPWGINPENYTFSTEKKIDIIGIGSLIPLKNYDIFLEIVKGLHHEKPIKVVIIGDGILRDLLQKKINSLQLEKVITLTGQLRYPETMNLLAQSKILLHPSRYESFGLVFAEALQLKTNIVSARVGCYFNSENWITSQNQTELIEACRLLLQKEQEHIVENPFTISKTITAYNTIYHA
jgi:glycosyltransferase involved in cell wall biosynthesis